MLSLWAGVRLLQYKQLPTTRILWYALNPLIILEICGNAHFEGAMIAFLALGLFFIYRQNTNVFSAMSFALSVASKMLTAMLLPMITFHYLKKKKWKWIVFTIIFLVISSIPISLNFNILTSLDLYFRKFKCNLMLAFIIYSDG